MCISSKQKFICLLVLRLENINLYHNDLNYRDADSNPCDGKGDLPRAAVPAPQQSQSAAKAREQGGEAGQEVQISVPGKCLLVLSQFWLTIGVNRFILAILANEPRKWIDSLLSIHVLCIMIHDSHFSRIDSALMFTRFVRELPFMTSAFEGGVRWVLDKWTK